ncbi:hypothetical protein [Mycobacterium sp. OTB74]|jgi:hypothetical protein|uniref:hypothetical protein n=1 Tax=Mycobacterium sp. OTB74 TaxID=1853452 RepID=UPI0024731232|nr:hypothetical protein [Mycobacterium sp. OTB74]MDH6243965.1 hypothetical protein [Mycobacterium sp. OTB74]
MRIAGDDTAIALPSHLAALVEAGSDFLTSAFHTYGTLSPDNAVTHITECAEVSGGSTGRKALLSVEYARPESSLPTELFVKFSRDLDDPLRDIGRTQMQPEVRFAELARQPGFPITVPATLFGDYHVDTGTGILITERIPFGVDGVEPQHHKCLDYEMPSPDEHYRTLVTSLAQLAGWHRSGAAADVSDRFPVDLQAATVGERPPLRGDKLSRQLSRLTEFADTHPGLLPANVRAPEFLSDLAGQIPVILAGEQALWSHLATSADHIALCHWNANVDNAWFWRDNTGKVQCGLLDWGCVSQLNIAMALWGALSAAEIGLWDEHFDDLVFLFAKEYHAAGGPPIDPRALTAQVLQYAAIMGATWLFDVPGLIRARLGESARSMTRFDPAIKHDEAIRAPLQMFTNVLNLWQTRDVGALLADLQ